MLELFFSSKSNREWYLKELQRIQNARTWEAERMEQDLELKVLRAEKLLRMMRDKTLLSSGRRNWRTRGLVQALGGENPMNADPAQVLKELLMAEDAEKAKAEAEAE